MTTEWKNGGPSLVTLWWQKSFVSCFRGRRPISPNLLLATLEHNQVVMVASLGHHSLIVEDRGNFYVFLWIPWNSYSIVLRVWFFGFISSSVGSSSP